VLKYLGETESGFDFISGTSVGSINAVGIAMFPVPQFKEATLYVEALWSKLNKTSDVWCIRKPLGIPALWNPSIGTNEALRKFLQEAVKLDDVQKSGIILRLPAVDLETGSIREFTVADLVTYGIDPILASASFPVAFPPVSVGTGWMTDGGIVDMAPLGAAIKAGATDITVLLTRDPLGVTYKSHTQMKNAFEVAFRVIDIMTETVLQGDLRLCEMTNALVDSEHPKAKGKKKVAVRTLYPSKPLGDSLDFSGDMMKAQMEQGYTDAQAQLGR
jgi:predicted acylesterase/phospholipase RssA